MITLNDIEQFKSIQKEIDDLVKNYYDKHIKGYSGYEYHGWHLTDENEIEIYYSYTDYRDEYYHDDVTISIDDLNNWNKL